MVISLNKYRYDELDRLIEAEGPNSVEAATFGPVADNTQDAHAKRPDHPGPGADAVEHYTHYCQYDALANILQLQPSAGAGSYTENYSYDPASDRS